MNCVHKFQHYKKKFVDFDNTTIVTLKGLLKTICDDKCYTSEGERFNFEKSLLTLDISVNGMITAIKFTVKHSIVKRLNTLENKLHFRKEKLNVYKLNVAGKWKLLHYSNQILTIFHQPLWVEFIQETTNIPIKMKID